MANDTRTPSNPLQVGRVLPVLALGALVLGGLVANEACDAEAGCVEGAREIWRGYLPDWTRKALRGIVQLITNPWLWALLVTVGIAERFRPARVQQRTFSNGLLHDVLAWFILDKLAFGLLIGMIFSYSAGLALYQEYLSFLTIDALIELPVIARGIIAFVVADFLNWLHHWVRHKVPAFWIFHAVHHSQTEMNLFTDDRIHPFDRVISMPISMIPMLILQLDVGVIPWILIAQMLYTHAYHGNLRTDYGPLRWILVTPQSHRVHHSMAPEYADTNFGVIFCLWDRLFGTQMDVHGEYPQTGVADPDFPMEQRATVGDILSAYVRQFLYPFVQIWRRVTTGRWELPAG